MEGGGRRGRPLHSAGRDNVSRDPEVEGACLGNSECLVVQGLTMLQKTEGRVP